MRAIGVMRHADKVSFSFTDINTITFEEKYMEVARRHKPPERLERRQTDEN